MKKILLVGLSALLLVGTSACSKKLSQLKSDYFTVNPNPLEVTGQKVDAIVSAAIPAKYMIKNAQLQVTPVLVYEAGETPSAPYTLQGENVRANGTVIPFQQGGSVMIPVAIPYKPDMAQSNLFLDFVANQNGKTYALPRVKVAEGVIATATLADAATVTPATARDAFQRVINEKYSADIHFLINQANVRSSELTAQGYTDLGKRLQQAAADSTRVIEGISVSSFASPEGSYDFNKALAEKREQSTNAAVAAGLKKDGIKEFGELTSQFTPEDWEGFRQLVAQSNIQDKALILDVLAMQQDPELREKEIRQLSGVFDELAQQILPQLRYSRVMASINVIGKSDQQLVDLFNTNPSALTADEILYIATLTSDNNKKMEVYNKAAEVYPSDYRTFNNLGLTQYVAGDYDGALSNFEHALRLNPQAKEPEMNKGLVQMLRGDYNLANQSLGLASSLPEAGDAMGVFYLQQGNLPAALQAFGNSKSNNAALARILNKDYAGARDVLTAISTPDATTYYLTALLGARTGNESMVLSNLRQAIRLDPSLRARAQKDLEFKSYPLTLL